jgi:hypothetical protein
MTGRPSDEVRLDERLEELSAGIVETVVIEPPEMKAKLRAPQLRVVKGVPNGLNNYCVPNSDGTTIILVGGLLYSFFLHYTRAAAAYFLPSTPDGPRPSPLWPQARSAVATALDWISSPASAPVFPPFDLTSHQEHVSLAFAAFSFRFALCHEMAHVALEHVDASPGGLGRVKDADFSVLRVSQHQELEADRFGLSLQVKSLRDSSQLVTALASSVYFVHITGLLNGRLMLLAHLVDEANWKIALTHPPALQRVLNLMGGAQAFGDERGAGLQSVHGSLATLDGEIYDTATKQQDSVANDTVGLLQNAIANVSTVGSIPATPASAVTEDLRRLFDCSPLGVMRALEPGAIDISAAPAGTAEKLKVLTEQFISTLPPEFQHFRGLTRAQRAEKMA